MRVHRHPEQLTAFLDGELDAQERSEIEAHLETCEECRGIVEALRATVSDLVLMPAPLPSPQDSWALRSAILRERATVRPPARRWQRIAMASGAVAAAAIAFVVIIIATNGGGGKSNIARNKTALANASVYQTDANYDALSAQARLYALAGGANSARAPGAGEAPSASSQDSGAARTLSGAPSTSDAETFAFLSRSSEKLSATPDDLAQCAQVVRDATTGDFQALEFEIAQYEGKPAFLLFFRAGDRIELWVMARGTCDLLYFQET